MELIIPLFTMHTILGNKVCNRILSFEISKERGDEEGNRSLLPRHKRFVKKKVIIFDSEAKKRKKELCNDNVDYVTIKHRKNSDGFFFLASLSFILSLSRICQ